MTKIAGKMEGNQRNAYNNYINMYPKGQEPIKSTPYPVDDLPEDTLTETSFQNMYPSHGVTERNMSSNSRKSAEGSSSRSMSNSQYRDVENRPTVPHNTSNESVARRVVPQAQFTSPSKSDAKDLSGYSEEAKQFYEVYNRTINDINNFTKEVQLKWCETLLQYAFKPSFLIRYNINAEKLRRDLTEEEMQQNQRTILEHALRVLTKLTNLNYAPALFLLGTLYSNQPYIPITRPSDIVGKNESKALDYYRKAADLGLKEALYRTGVCFEYGRGVDYSVISEVESLRLARAYYEKSSLTKGDSSSMYKLGMFYLKGLSTKSKEAVIKKDPMQALYWFRMAIDEIKIPSADIQPVTLDSISPQAMIELGKIYGFEEIDTYLKNELLKNGISKDQEKSIKYYYRCAHELNYSWAQFKLGHFYEFGEMGLPVLPKKSIAWYAKSSLNKTKPNPMAMTALSGWYLTGAEGVLKPNDKEASFQMGCPGMQAERGKISKSGVRLGLFFREGYWVSH